MAITPEEIIEFWYSDRIKSQWFASTPELDREILDNYENSWLEASQGELDDWSNTALSSLALIIILDQFPLNMFRGQAKSFKTESKAVEVALHAFDNNFDHQIAPDKLSFLVMPLMHSEDLPHQELSVKYYKSYKLDGNIRFAKHHRDIIKEFGRFPHRNEILGRESTQQEIEYLTSKRAFMG